MKNFLWCILSFGISYAILNAIITIQVIAIDIPLYLPLLFMPLYLLFIAAYYNLPTQRRASNNRPSPKFSAIIYGIEALTIVVISLVMGKLVGSPHVAAWLAAFLLLMAPSSRKVRIFLLKAQKENEKE